MRVVHAESNLLSSIQITKSEAKAAFGDATVYLEKFLEKPRHVEVQVLADKHGNAIHLFRSRLLTTTPSSKGFGGSTAPRVEPKARAGFEACVTACKTWVMSVPAFEFLYEDGRFYFIEMNTRVQVEHPVSEMVTGIDIIHEQISVAAGNPYRSRKKKSKSTATQLSAVSMQRIQILSCQALINFKVSSTRRAGRSRGLSYLFGLSGSTALRLDDR